MTTTPNKFAAAALAGIFSVGIMTAGVAHANEGAAMVKSSSIEKTDAAAKEKHACKGMNACKGQGADGKNACKGHGSCRTDGEGDKK